MKYGQIPGLEKPVSRLVMGVDNQVTWPHASAMFDDFFAQGGNCFDTAYKYGEGRCEEMLGQWIKDRGMREQVVIVGKGAHTPYCTPEWVEVQLERSLNRLQTDYVDIYMLHRDNPDIPVKEFVQALHQQKMAGRIQALGVSNWSIERVDQANRYAQQHGMSGFVALSNHFSLAHMVRPVWTGCVSATDTRSREWLISTGIAFMPWSSQARGFFREQKWEEKDPQSPLMRGWYSQDNLQRLERVKHLSCQRQILPNTLALAYVLNQPYLTFPLIGPRTPLQTHTSFQALDVSLSEEELRWLNLEE